MQHRLVLTYISPLMPCSSFFNNMKEWRRHYHLGVWGKCRLVAGSQAVCPLWEITQPFLLFVLKIYLEYVLFCYCSCLKASPGYFPGILCFMDLQNQWRDKNTATEFDKRQESPVLFYWWGYIYSSDTPSDPTMEYSVRREMVLSAVEREKMSECRENDLNFYQASPSV